MRSLPERKANIAIAQSLLETVYVMLRDGGRIRSPIPAPCTKSKRRSWCGIMPNGCGNSEPTRS